MFVGASGGGDSTALLLLLADVARAQGRRLVAGVVDHALRPGSDADAESATRIAAGTGAEVRSVRLDWPNGPKSAQAHARAARYAALALMAREIGACTLFLGHTLDDQAETLLMRAEAGSGARGLAGMALLSPCPIWPAAYDLQLARPLLAWRRAALRDLLRTAGIDWLEDPANIQPRYARVRARAALAASGEAEGLALRAEASAAVAADTDRAALAWLGAHVVIDQGAATVRSVTADDACIRALAALATAVGGSSREPSPAAVARLVARLMAGQDGTLAGARFRAGAPVHVTRDPGGVLGRRGGGQRLADLALPVGETVVWDGRLALTALAPGWSVVASVGMPKLRLGGETRTPAGAPVTVRWLVGPRIARLLWRAGA